MDPQRPSALHSSLAQRFELLAGRAPALFNIAKRQAQRMQKWSVSAVVDPASAQPPFFHPSGVHDSCDSCARQSPRAIELLAAEDRQFYLRVAMQEL